MRILFEQQREEMNDKLETGKGFKRPLMVNDILFDKEDYMELFEDAAKPHYIAAISDVGNDVLAELIADVKIDIETKPVVAFVDKFTRKYSKVVNETTLDELRVSLQDGIDLGESIPHLRERIDNIMMSATRERATMIARTETVRASNFGAEQAMVQSGVVDGKEWVVALDERTCEECMGYDGKVIDLGGIFKEDSYADVKAPPLHPHCRCTIVPVISED